jgi:hypothetical protein
VKNYITDRCFIRKSVEALITNEHYCLSISKIELKLHEYTTLYRLPNACANFTFFPLLATQLGRRPYLFVNPLVQSCANGKHVFEIFATFIIFNIK